MKLSWRFTETTKQTFLGPNNNLLGAKHCFLFSLFRVQIESNIYMLKFLNVTNSRLLHNSQQKNTANRKAAGLQQDQNSYVLYLRNLLRSPCFMYSNTMMSGSPSTQTP